VFTTQYVYNGKGERVLRQDVGAGDVTTVYDEAGRWLGDYDVSGAPFQQVIWLDDLPIGLLAARVGGGQNWDPEPDPGPGDPQPSIYESMSAGAAQPSTMGGERTLYYVEPDHLGTPRSVIDPVRNVAMWSWDLASEAFGNSPPNQDPDNDGTGFVFDMRFPGQRYDPASGLNYNYFRDYEPDAGRYTQSDPIGLDGGLSTYGYVYGNPLTYEDRYGLGSVLACANPANAAACAAAGIGAGSSSGVSTGGVVAGAAATTTAVQLTGDSAQSRSLPYPMMRRGKWTCMCRADCNDNIPGNCPEDPSQRYAFGVASHESFTVAKKEAKRAATKNLGCQPKHVPCRCTGPGGEYVNAQ